MRSSCSARAVALAAILPWRFNQCFRKATARILGAIGEELPMIV
jgi:hypothetical protein